MRLICTHGKGASLNLVVFMIREYFANKQGQKRPLKNLLLECLRPVFACTPSPPSLGNN